MKQTNDTKRLDNIAVFLSNLGFQEFESSRGMYTHELFPAHMFDLSASGDSPKDITANIFKRIVQIGEWRKQDEIKTALGL